MNFIRLYSPVLSTLLASCLVLLWHHPAWAKDRVPRRPYSAPVQHVADHASAQERRRAVDAEDRSADGGGVATASDLDSDDDEVEYGPWKVPVPSYLRGGWGLRLRGRYVTLDLPLIRLKGDELPEYVALIGPGGRVLHRRKTFITQHLLTGFHMRLFRISGVWGTSGTTSSANLAQSLPTGMVESGIDSIYQPTRLGVVVGLHAASGLIRSGNDGADAGEQSYRTNELRLGATWELGLAPRSDMYRWHSLVQGGILVGSAKTTASNLVESLNQLPATGKPDRSREHYQSTSGIYAACDALYMWEHWWWGARILVKRQSLSGAGDRPQGEYTTTGLQAVSSYTW